MTTQDFLDHGWPEIGIEGYEARRLFTTLANEALGLLFKGKGLHHYWMANRQSNCWLGKGSPDNRIRFNWPNQVGSRQLQRYSKKRKVFWHFGVSTAFRGRPFPHVGLKSHLIFTEDGIAPLKSSNRMHKLRRSFAKSWRNARWRDMMLAFLFWIGDGTTVLNIPVGTGEDLVLSLPPVSFACPVSTPILDSPDEDDDDPDVDFVNDDDDDLDDDAEETIG
jgi:hypothetical protein